MEIFRGFRLGAEQGKYGAQFASSVRRDEKGRIHTALYTDFFSGGSERIMRSNCDYAQLKDDLSATLEPYSVKEDVVIDIYEPTASDEFVRETSLIGFRRYVGACCESSRKIWLRHLVTMLASLALGLVLVLLLSVLPLDGSLLLRYLIETVASVLVWQCVGYLAYNCDGEVRQMRRLEQMMRAEFTYKVWD